MKHAINIYCDESCHLQNDEHKAMVLGGLWCYKVNAGKFNHEIAEIKRKHNLSRYCEIKWTKISNGKLQFYLDLVNYFFDTPALFFRGWIIPDKSILEHDKHFQTHDDWYYKMYFYLLRNLIDRDHQYYIYLDIKDTRSRNKLKELHDVLTNAHYDFSREIIKDMQHVHSHDICLMQLSDLLIGALSYKTEGLSSNDAKLEIINLIKERTGFSLERNTLPSERKFDMCFWRPNNGL